MENNYGNNNLVSHSPFMTVQESEYMVPISNEQTFIKQPNFQWNIEHIQSLANKSPLVSISGPNNHASK